MSGKYDQKRSSSRKWQAHVEALDRSGMSRAEYCRQHNLSYHALTYWCRKFHLADQSPVLVQVPVVRPVAGKPMDNQKTSGVSIRLNNRIAIELAEQFSPATLDKVLAVLEGR